MIISWTPAIVEEARRALQEARPGVVGEITGSAGHSRTYLSRVLNGEIKRMEVETFCSLVSHPEVDTAKFLTRIGLDLTFRPLVYLERIQQQHLSDPQLEQLERAAEIADGGAGEGSEVEDLLAALRRNDELRFSDKRAAKEELPSLLDACCRSGSRALIGRALASYAETRRLDGQYGLAARAVRRALVLSDEISRLRVDALQSTAYLLSNHGWAEAAEECAKQGVEISVQLHALERIGKMLYTRAVMVDRQGEAQSALGMYQAALAYFPDELWTYRCAAHHEIAWCHLLLGHEGSLAWNALEECIRAHRTKEGLNWLKTIWLQAELAFQQRKPQVAEGLLRRVVSGYAAEADANPIDVAIVSLELAKALLLNGKAFELQELARSLLAVLTPLQHNQVASAAIAQFIRAAEAGQATLALVERIARRLKELGAPRDKAPHSPFRG